MEVLQAKEAEPIYESCWYPLMNAQDPATCCFLTSARDHPVHLWDCTTGQLRASYSVIDHRERFMGAIGLTFNLDGSSIYCGYENMIQVFDTSRPGSTAVSKISTTPTRKSRMGQKGIISSLAFSPDYSGLLAAGSYSKNIGLYDTSSGEICSVLGGLDGGVTQVRRSSKHIKSSSLLTCRCLVPLYVCVWGKLGQILAIWYTFVFRKQAKQFNNMLGYTKYWRGSLPVRAARIH